MKIVACSLSCVLLAGVAGAQDVRINESAVGGVTVDLKAGNLAGSVFGSASPDLTTGALTAIHADLAASSINTDDIVTVLPLLTDDGLALFQLIDRQDGAFGAFNAMVDYTGVAFDPDASGIRAWLNDAGGELFQSLITNPVAQSYTTLATFQWDAAARGDGAAFSGLTAGDHGSSAFSPFEGVGLNGMSRGFQYLSYENGTWVVAHSGKFNPGLAATSFDWSVIPTPGTGAIALMGTALFWRRRR